MTEHSQFQSLSFDDLFKRLSAEGEAATVVTPNRRLAQALKNGFDQFQLDQKQVVWQSADILPFAVFLERIYLDALYTGGSFDIPLLITATQEKLLWEVIVQSSEAGKTLLNIKQTARLVQEAWKLLHAWRLSQEIKHVFLNEDAEAFCNWAALYEAQLEQNHQVDHARLSDWIVQFYEHMQIQKTACLICYGFNLLTPQQTAFLKRLQTLGTTVSLVQPPVVVEQGCIGGGKHVARVCYTDSEEEIYQAARWSRKRLEENPKTSIGIVIPELARCRQTVQRVFSEVMRPDVREALPRVHAPQLHNRPFNISIGQPLSDYPLVDAALSVLMLIEQGLTFEQAGQLIRSPFLEGGETEMSQRAVLEIRLREHAEPFVTLEQFVTLLLSVESGAGAECPVLLQKCSSLLSFCKQDLPDMGRHAEYAQLFSQILHIMGFPGERTLDSTEYQTLKKWHEVLTELAALDRVMPATCYKKAVSRLNDIAAGTLFQPQTPAVPIQVLGVFEAAGMVFDHLWVIGLSDEQWPLRPRPNPFLPYELQKKTAMPFGSNKAVLDYSRQLQDHWLSCAKEVILSHPKFDDGMDAQELAPSSMIRSVPACSVDLPLFRRHLDLIMETAYFEHIIDDHVTLAINNDVTGGVAVIKDYAACPFRAWARYQTGVNQVNKPHTGLNALERGILVHHVLAAIWKELKTKETLDHLAYAALEKKLKTAAREAILHMQRQRPYALPGRVAVIEQRRLVRLVREWLNEERQRAGFTVVAIEEKKTIHVGKLILQGRLDRIDQLENGQLLIIDYKTRKYPVDAMLGERPDEPQLPLYLVMTEPCMTDAVGVAFASIKNGQLGFTAIVSTQDLLPGVKAFDNTRACMQFATWDELLTQWQQDLLQLANGFLEGDARVSPKNYPQTCQYCDMQPFCRIHERISVVVEDREAENE